jgi:hypothetical protein
MLHSLQQPYQLAQQQGPLLQGRQQGQQLAQVLQGQQQQQGSLLQGRRHWQQQGYQQSAAPSPTPPVALPSCCMLQATQQLRRPMQQVTAPYCSAQQMAHTR